MEQRLTELTVPKLAPGVYMDDRTPDFGLRVGVRRRSWIVVQGRGRVKTTIGHYPAMSVADARTAAKKLLANDTEPGLLRRTFLEARDEFLEGHYVGKSAGTKYQVSRALKKHCRGSLGAQPTSGSILTLGAHA
jgi:hypothetical protein